MKRISFFSFVFLLVVVCTFVTAQTPNAPQSEARTSFRVIQVDAGKVTGKIRSFQGLNGPPHPIMEGLPDLVQQYRDLRIDSIRTHDIMGPTDVAAHYSTDRPLLIWLVPDLQQRTRLVNAANEGAIFPDWNADPEKPESYHFGPSDKFIQSIREAHAEVYYRIGRSFGADYTALPDFDKFASVVKHIAMHYNQGWANGFHDNIRYWEFWNEEDLPFFWTETPERFYTLYEKTARALKSVDPAMKVGADALALPFSGGPYREGLIAYCASHKVPLDFYSWHSYALTSADPYDVVRIGDDIRKLLDANGFRQTESILSEWNLTPDFTERERARIARNRECRLRWRLVDLHAGFGDRPGALLPRRRRMDGPVRSARRIFQAGIYFPCHRRHAEDSGTPQSEWGGYFRICGDGRALARRQDSAGADQ